MISNNNLIFLHLKEHWIQSYLANKLKIMHPTSVKGVDDMVCTVTLHRKILQNPLGKAASKV